MRKYSSAQGVAHSKLLLSFSLFSYFSLPLPSSLTSPPIPPLSAQVTPRSMMTRNFDKSKPLRTALTLSVLSRAQIHTLSSSSSSSFSSTSSSSLPILCVCALRHSKYVRGQKRPSRYQMRPNKCQKRPDVCQTRSLTISERVLLSISEESQECMRARDM